MALLTSLLTSFFSSEEPVKRKSSFFVKDFFEVLGDQGFIVGVDGDCF